MSITLWLALGIVVAIIFWAIAAYNRLVSLTNRGKEAWADIQVQLKRRYDLIPNLVETVKGYADHEKNVFEDVTNARTKAMSVPAQATTGEKAAAENALSGTLKSLFAVAENYPDLKANQNFLQLQRDLTDTEDKIQAARRFYNGNVRDLNTAEQSFPGNLVSSFFGFKPMNLFELSESEAAAVQDAPKVQF